jgi:hypothetical protein
MKIVLSTEDLDKACELYLRNRGITPGFWEVSTEETRHATREEVMDVMAKAMGPNVTLADWTD